MPNKDSKDLKLLQKLNKQTRSTKVGNKQHTLLTSLLLNIVRLVLLIVTFYASMITFMLLKGGTW